MNLHIQRTEPTADVARALILALNADLDERYPEGVGAHYRLDVEEVAPGRGAFLVAYVDGEPAGCGALRRIDEAAAEIKRMYVDASMRNRGVARALLAAIEAEGRAIGVRRLVLETGVRQPEAIRLYASSGFYVIPPFGEYVDGEFSVCMAKELR